MRIIILIFIILVSCGPVNIGVKELPIQKKEIKGYEIQYHAERDKYGMNCKAHISVNRKNSKIDELYVEVQALDKNKSLLSVAYFLLKDLQKNQIIRKNAAFKEIKSCAKIEKLDILGG